MLLLELGAEWLGRDKQQEALACAEEAYARYPYWPQTHVLYADTLLASGQARKATEVCTAALEAFPGQTDIWRAFAAAACENGQAALASAKLKTHLEAYPGKVLLWRSLGQCLESAGRFEAALRAYDRGIARAQERARGERDLVRLAGLKEHQGDILLAMGDAAAARRKYREAIDLRPTVYPLYEKLSNSYVDAGDLEGLRNEWESAVAEHPKRTQAHYCLGLAWHRLAKLEKAIASYRRALELDPSGQGTRECLARALKTRAEEHRQEGRVEAAEEDLAAARRVNPPG